MKKILNLIIICLIFSNLLHSQSNISFRFSTLSINPIDTLNTPIYKTKIIKNGALTIEPGIFFSGELFGNDYTSVKFSQSLRIDPCYKIMTTSQLLLRYRLYKRYKNTLTISIGPVLFIRQTWQSIPNYLQEEYYLNSIDFQNSVMWFSAEFEYNRHVSKHGDFVLTLSQLSPRSFGILVGYKYWMKRKSTKCNTCPSFRN